MFDTMSAMTTDRLPEAVPATISDIPTPNTGKTGGKTEGKTGGLPDVGPTVATMLPLAAPLRHDRIADRERDGQKDLYTGTPAVRGGGKHNKTAAATTGRARRAGWGKKVKAALQQKRLMITGPQRCADCGSNKSATYWYREVGRCERCHSAAIGRDPPGTINRG